MMHKPKRLPIPKQRADGQWVVRWRYRLAGREHRPARLFRTEAEANGFILRELAGESNRDPRAARLTFDAYADRYLADLAPSVKATTLGSERSKLRHARAFFGSTPVSEIRPSDCRTFRAALAEGGTAGGRKLKREAARNHAYRVLRAVLELAVEDQAITVNPATIAGRKRRTTKEPKFRAVFLDAGQVEALAAAAPAPYDLVLRFLAYTGLRAAELAGLDIADVKLWRTKDSWRGYVDVHRTRRKAGGGWVEDTPKSERSTRRVALPPWLAADLADYLSNTHERPNEPNAPLFPGRKPGPTYVTGPDGRKVRGGFRLNWAEPVEPSAMYRTIFKRALVEAGLPERTRLHDLRHTFAALWLAAGGDIKQLSEQMGHEKYTTTFDFYAHLIPPDEDQPHVFAERPAKHVPAAPASNVRPLRLAR